METHYVTQRGQGCISPQEHSRLVLEHTSTPQTHPTLQGRGSPGQGRTCQFSLLGEVSRAGAAGDTHEGGSHLGVPTIDIHVTAGHRQLKTRGTGRLAPSRNTGVGLKSGWLVSERVTQQV